MINVPLSWTQEGGGDRVLLFLRKTEVLQRRALKIDSGIVNLLSFLENCCCNSIRTEVDGLRSGLGFQPHTTVQHEGRLKTEAPFAVVCIESVQRASFFFFFFKQQHHYRDLRILKGMITAAFLRVSIQLNHHKL